MKKYLRPQMTIEEIILDDVIAESQESFGDSQAGDKTTQW